VRSFLWDIGGHQEKDARDEQALRRDIIIEKWWWNQMNKMMKQIDELQKDIESDSGDRQKLEELWKLQRRGILDKQWLKERRGERGKDSRGSR